MSLRSNARDGTFREGDITWCMMAGGGPGPCNMATGLQLLKHAPLLFNGALKKEPLPSPLYLINERVYFSQLNRGGDE